MRDLEEEMVQPVVPTNPIEPRGSLPANDPLTQWMLENSEGRWLYDAEHGALFDLSMLAADACAGQDILRALLAEARWFVTDALEAHEHSDGRELLRRIDAALGNSDVVTRGATAREGPPDVSNSPGIDTK